MKPELVVETDPQRKCCEEICSVAFSPDGRIIATKLYQSGFKEDHGILFWEAGTGRLLKSIQGTPSGIYNISFSPDGQMITSDYGLLWDVRSGDFIRKIGDSSHRLTGAVFSPGGKIMATGNRNSPRTILLWDVQANNVIQIFISENITGLANRFCLGGSTLISKGAADSVIEFRSVSDGKLIRKIKTGSNGYDELAVSGDGRIITVPGPRVEEQHSIDIFNAYSGKRIHRLDGHASRIWSLALTLDGRFLASSSSDLTVKLWDVTSGSLIHTLAGHSEIIRSVTFSPDGRYIASGGGNNETKIWSVQTGQLLLTLQTFNDGNWIAYTPEGYYNRSDGASKYITWRVGTEIYDEAKYKNFYLKPEVIARRLLRYAN
jgi:WD40 repeat protein